MTLTQLDGAVEAAQANLIARVAAGTNVRRVRWSAGETQVFELGSGSPLLYVHGGLGGAYELADGWPVADWEAPQEGDHSEEAEKGKEAPDLWCPMNSCRGGDDE